MAKQSVFWAFFILFLSGCSSLPLNQARTAFYEGNLGKAEQALEDCRDIIKKDRLLCYMEKGVVLHYLGEYEKSTEVLLKASHLMETQDQISVTEQTSAVLINERVTDYKGEYSEQLWVHTFLMMNFLLRYDYESALVEAKQALELYDKYPGSLVDDYYSRALIALCFENMGMPDDARIEYERLAEAMGGEKIAAVPIAAGKGELILFIGQGRVPYKVADEVAYPPSIRISLPRYTDFQPIPAVSIQCDGQSKIPGPEDLSPLKISTDLGRVAKKSLDDRSAAYLARQALRAGAKEAIAQEIGEHNELGEAVARIILFLLEEADTRSWETLPGGLTLVRMELDAGVHNLEISSGYAGSVYMETVDIPEGSRVYRSIRF
jgi:hypothetical protein